MIRRLTFTIISASLILLQSCNKDNIDLLAGTWEWVNVENINDLYLYEWEFENGNLTIYRRLKTNPGTFSVFDRGFYIVDSNPLRTTLKLTDTANPTWNNQWVVSKLNNSQLIIKMEIEGGVLYREYIRKN